MARYRRRSLLQRNDPAARGSDPSPVDAPEDAPQLRRAMEGAALPRPASAPNRGRHEPRDPGLVDIDLTFDELPELSDDAIEIEALDVEDMEALDDALVADMPAMPATAADRAPAPVGREVDTTDDVDPVPVRPPVYVPPIGPPAAPVTAALAPPNVAPVIWTPPPPAPSPVPLMLVAFGGSMAVTLALVLIPWFVFVSPSLQAVRARLTAPPAPPAPLVIQVPAPTPAPAPEPVAAVTPPDAAQGAPAPTPAPPAAVAQVSPRAAGAQPTPRPRRPTPAPTLTVTPAPAPTAAPAPKQEPAARPEPAPVGPTNLSGRFTGAAGGDTVTLDLTFQPGGRLVARIERAGVAPMDVVGGYTPTASGASFVITEPGAEGWVYTGTADGTGATGQVKFPDGKRKKLKVKR